MASLVLVIDAADQPGIVSTVATAVADVGGNRIAADLARFGGRVAGLVLVEVPDAEEASLRSVLAGLGAGRDLRIEVHTAGRAPDLTDLVHVEITGPDRPGILGEIVTALEEMGVTVDSLRNVSYDAPGPSGALFDADAVLELPKDRTMSDVRACLSRLGDQFTLDEISED